MWKLALIVLFVLGGCAQAPQQPQSKTFNLASSKDRGLLVTSVRLELPEGTTPFVAWASLTVRPKGAEGRAEDRVLSSRDGGIVIEGEKLARLNVLPLPPGEYRIVRMDISGFTATLREPPVFTIRPGRATYLGMVRVQSLPSLNYRLDTRDEQARDIPLMMKHWPGVPREAVDVQLLTANF